jgi:mono/diheme cytochrome c family protein
MAAGGLRLGVRTGLVFLVLAVVGLGLLVYEGACNVAADDPHFPVVRRLIDVIRDRSIAVRSEAIVLPADLGDPKRVAMGAGLYSEMCSGCHLAPGKERTEISQGLYPRAPQLSRGTDLSPQEQFWIIKHGIKMTGMAAWGVTHSDTLIWDMVAFLRKLPSFSEHDYREAVKNAPEDHDHAMHDMNMDKGEGDEKGK